MAILAQTLRLVVVFICIVYFSMFAVFGLLSGLNELSIALIASSFLTLLIAYWLYIDGRKLDILIQHLGVKDKVTTELVAQLDPKESAPKRLRRQCGNCMYYLTKDCPAEYSSDEEVWRQQRVCGLYMQKDNA